MRGLRALLTKGKQVKRCDTKTYGKDNSSICKIVRKKKICVHFIVSKTTNVTEISGVELYQLCGRWGHHGAPPNVSTYSTVRTTPSYLGRLFFLKKLSDLLSQASRPPVTSFSSHGSEGGLQRQTEGSHLCRQQNCIYMLPWKQSNMICGCSMSCCIIKALLHV